MNNAVFRIFGIWKQVLVLVIHDLCDIVYFLNIIVYVLFIQYIDMYL